MSSSRVGTGESPLALRPATALPQGRLMADCQRASGRSLGRCLCPHSCLNQLLPSNGAAFVRLPTVPRVPVNCSTHWASAEGLDRWPSLPKINLWTTTSPPSRLGARESFAREYSARKYFREVDGRPGLDTAILSLMNSEWNPWSAGRGRSERRPPRVVNLRWSASCV